MGVPGPTRVNSSLSSGDSMAQSLLARPELHVLVGGGIEVVGDQSQTGLGHARPNPVEKGGLVEGHEHHALVHELLDLLEECLALLAVDLAGLLAEEPVDV